MGEFWKVTFVFIVSKLTDNDKSQVLKDESYRDLVMIYNYSSSTERISCEKDY